MEPGRQERGSQVLERGPLACKSGPSCPVPQASSVCAKSCRSPPGQTSANITLDGQQAARALAWHGSCWAPIASCPLCDLATVHILLNPALCSRVLCQPLAEVYTASVPCAQRAGPQGAWTASKGLRGGQDDRKRARGAPLGAGAAAAWGRRRRVLQRALSIGPVQVSLLSAFEGAQRLPWRHPRCQACQLALCSPGHPLPAAATPLQALVSSRIARAALGTA